MLVIFVCMYYVSILSLGRAEYRSHCHPCSSLFGPAPAHLDVQHHYPDITSGRDSHSHLSVTFLHTSSKLSLLLCIDGTSVYCVIDTFYAVIFVQLFGAKKLYVGRLTPYIGDTYYLGTCNLLPLIVFCPSLCYTHIQVP